MEELRGGKTRYGARYPPPDRLKLNQPYTKSIDGERIWSQIPLYGTTVIALKPTRIEMFERTHGFEVEDIGRLIDFTKKTIATNAKAPKDSETYPRKTRFIILTIALDRKEIPEVAKHFLV